jgi:hypothetical protein
MHTINATHAAEGHPVGLCVRNGGVALHGHASRAFSGITSLHGEQQKSMSVCGEAMHCLRHGSSSDGAARSKASSLHDGL